LDTLTAEKLAEVLQEPNVLLLRQVLRVLGEARCRDILADTLTIESQGGMLTKAGPSPPYPWRGLLPPGEGP
jgi:PHAX RNA-binding domain